TDTIDISEKSTDDKDEILTKHDVHHCRTKCNIRKTDFIWNITNFWNICSFVDTLTSSDIEDEFCKINMCINREKDELYFFICSTVSNPKKHINIQRYYIYIESTEGAILCTDWKRFYLNSDPLYKVCLKTLQLNERKYSPNNTLSVHFTFESYETVFHMTMNENLIDQDELINVFTTAFSFNESISTVTFVVDGKHLHVNKSLLCASSSYFSKMLRERNKDTEKEIEISDVAYDIFRIITIYINSMGVFELKLGETDNDSIRLQTMLMNLLNASERFQIRNLKIVCEKRLIAFITKANVLIYLDIAITNNAVYLEEYVKKYIKLHLDDIKYDPYFITITKNKPEILSDIYGVELTVEGASYIKYNED
ncbi:Ankyrin repeat and BTB/POZ domain-containing protein BTBD11-B, partial [Cyphomyrmex costatus]